MRRDAFEIFPCDTHLSKAFYKSLACIFDFTTCCKRNLSHQHFFHFCLIGAFEMAF